MSRATVIVAGRSSREHMDDEQIRSTIMAAIRAVAPEADLQGIDPGRPLVEQVELDSMDWLNVAAALQERLPVGIPEGELDREASVDSILAFVASRLERRPGAPSVRVPTTPRAPGRTTHEVGGKTVTVRPIHREDKPLEAEFVLHLSADARYKRFMATLRELSKAKLDYLTDVDQVGHVALMATVEQDGRTVPVGIGRYIVDAGGTGCEFSIAVDDAWQGSGLAGILMHELMEIARSRGLATMEGIVLAANSPMLHFARQLGFTLQHDPEDRTVVRVVRPL